MSSPRRPTAAVIALLIAVTLAGCASAAPGAPPAPEQPTACGEYELDQGESIPQEAVDCMAEAGENGATLTVTTPTVEGDPIVTTYTALPDGGMEVYADMTEDRYGGGTSLVVCPDAVSVLDLGTCDEVPDEG